MGRSAVARKGRGDLKNNSNSVCTFGTIDTLTDSTIELDVSATRQQHAQSRSPARCSSPTVTLPSTMSLDEFSIFVAARVRPFNKREVEEHRETQRRKNGVVQPLSPLERAQMHLSRHQQRCLFGPTAGMQQGEHEGAGTAGSDFEDPVPIVDLEDDTTLLLRDSANPGVARGAFSFDCVFSCFAPSVEIDDDEGCGGYASLNFQTAGHLLEDGNFIAGAPVLGAGMELSPSQESLAEAEQRLIYNTLGRPLIECALVGYNACIFAYGQTGSGKTYTMLGSQNHVGIIPRLCHDLFRRIDEELRANAGKKRCSTIRVTMSCMEIYNENVKDLLRQRPKNAVLHYNSRFDRKEVDHEEYQALKVRQHPQRGLFVEGLSTVAVSSWEECKAFLMLGSQLRTQANTRMNEVSSRSHAIFQFVVTRSESMGTRVRGLEVTNDRISKINLVDLAGSERNASTSAKHMAEANSINTSLATLRRVIDGLVSKKKNVVIPYRESLLTYVLSDNFGGNSKTVMCANVSPYEQNLNETESTLRYATLTRSVRNRIKINESPSAKVIRELKGRIKQLQDELSAAQLRNQQLMAGNGLRGSSPVSAISLPRGQQPRISPVEAATSSPLLSPVAVNPSSNKVAVERDRLEKQLLDDLRRHEQEEERWRREAQEHKAHTKRIRRVVKQLLQEHPDLEGPSLKILEEELSLSLTATLREVLPQGEEPTSPRNPPSNPRQTPQLTLPEVQRKNMLHGLHVEGDLGFSKGRGTPLSLLEPRPRLIDGSNAPASAPPVTPHLQAKMKSTNRAASQAQKFGREAVMQPECLPVSRQPRPLPSSQRRAPSAGSHHTIDESEDYLIMDQPLPITIDSRAKVNHTHQRHTSHQRRSSNGNSRECASTAPTASGGSTGNAPHVHNPRIPQTPPHLITAQSVNEGGDSSDAPFDMYQDPYTRHHREQRRGRTGKLGHNNGSNAYNVEATSSFVDQRAAIPSGRCL